MVPERLSRAFQTVSCGRRDGVAESEYSKSIVVEARAGDPRDIPAYTAAPMRGTPRARSAARSADPDAVPRSVTLTAGGRGAAVGPPAPRAARIRSRIPRILDYRTVRERLNQIRTTTGTRPSAARPALSVVTVELSRSDDRFCERQSRGGLSKRRTPRSAKPPAGLG